MTLDLKRPADLARVKELLATADIVANSFSPGVMERLGLSWAEIAGINPRAIYLGMPFAGDEGLYRDYLGYGINIATLVGMFGRHALAGRLPVGTGTNFPDHLPNPLHACFAVLAALAWRERSRQRPADRRCAGRVDARRVSGRRSRCGGQRSRVAAARRTSSPGARRTASIDAGRGSLVRALRRRRRGVRAPVRAARARGSAAVCAPCRAQARSTRWSRAWFAQRSAEDALAALRAAGIAAAIVATPDDLLHRDPQLAARGFWQYLDHPVMGRGVYHGVAAAFSLTPTRYRTGAPLLGQHNDELARLHDGVLVKD